MWQRWREAKRLALLATFEDSATGMRVKEFCQDLSRSLGQECQIIEHVWLFSTLRLRELQEIAAEEASTSDLVIISVHQAKSLPDEVKSWIDLWRTCRTSPGGEAWNFWWNQWKRQRPAGKAGDNQGGDGSASRAACCGIRR
jgi:hypothetical protein